MLYLAQPPAPPLNRWVDCIWYCERGVQPHRLERVLPTGCAQLIVNLKEDRIPLCEGEGLSAVGMAPGTILGGVRSRYCVIDTAAQECIMGVAFRAGGTVPFFRPPAGELCDADIPLESLWGPSETASLRERLLAASGPRARIAVLESELHSRLGGQGTHPAVDFALAAFRRGCPVAAVTDAVGFSARHFIDLFKAGVGLTPKQYSRIVRFQDALGAAARGSRVDWARIAAECGYFDQAHFIHDFRAFSGMTPTGYQISRTEFQNHVKFLQADAGAVVS